MNILDENIPHDQLDLLKSWRVPVRQIGFDVARKGIQDDEILPFLRQLRRPTFFTRDADFFKRTLCHGWYCLVYLAVEPSEAGLFARRLLRHREFDTQAKRMGTIIRVAQPGLMVWRLHAEQEANYAWYE